MKTCTTLIVCILALFTQANAQSPGNVSTNLTSWFKADANVTTSGTSVSSWQSTDGSTNLAQSTSSRRPTFNNGSGSKLFNYNDFISFDGTEWLYDATASNLVLHTGGAIFIVTKPNDGKPQLSYDHNNLLNIDIKGDRIGMTVTNSGTSKWQAKFNLSPIYSANSDVVYETALRMTEVNGSPDCEFNGSDVTTASTTSSGAVCPNNALVIGANGTTSASYKSNTNIAELITYDADLTQEEIDRVTSYLCMKYGITKGINGVSENYTDSNGDIIFDRTISNGYNYDVIAVGVDNNSGLNITKSSSVNGYGLASTSYRDPVRLETLSGSPQSDGDFLFISNDNGALYGSILSTPIPNGANPIESVLQRTWQVQHNSPLYGANFIVDYSSFIQGGNIDDLWIMIDADGDFSSGATMFPFVDNGGTEIYQYLNTGTAQNGYYIKIGSSDASQTPLPVELVDFSYAERGEHLELLWKTASEEKFSHYEVEKSNNTASWRSLEKIYSNGGTGLQHYSFMDTSVDNGYNYYRLKMVDLDGTVEYSKTLLYHRKTNTLVDIYPNPVKDLLTIDSEEYIGSELKIYDMQGRICHQSTLSQPRTTMNTADFRKGFYIIKITNNGNSYSQRLLVQ